MGGGVGGRTIIINMKGETNMKSSPPTNTTSGVGGGGGGSNRSSIAATVAISPAGISAFPGASGMLAAQLQRPPRTISGASYDDSESDDGMQQQQRGGGPSSVATPAIDTGNSSSSSISRVVDSDGGEKADVGGNSASK